MGIFTIYDILTGNPGAIHNLTGENKKIYGWNEKVRAVLKDGSVSKIGHYEYNGDVVYKDTKKSVFDLFPKEHRIAVIDDEIYDYDADGFLLNNKVYNLLKKNKKFKKCTKKKNLYQLLDKFIIKNNKKLNTNLSGMQQTYIPENNKDENKDDKFIKKRLWMLVDPDLDTKDGKRNKERINKIINNFLEFACKYMSNIEGITQLKFIFKDNKSDKFWNIEYTNNEYKVHYGKTGTKGQKISKKVSLDKIEKLIEGKKKKGYKQKSKKNIKKFTL